MSNEWTGDRRQKEILDGIEEGIRGEGGAEAWAVLERIAAAEPELFADLIRVIQARHRPKGRRRIRW